MWQNRFGAAPDVVGRSIRFDGEANDIIGVLPESFNDWRHLGEIDGAAQFIRSVSSFSPFFNCPTRDAISP